MIDPTMPAMSLEEWRRAFGLQPWFFWGMGASSPAGLRLTAQAGDILTRSSWQSDDAAGRDDILAAIRSAERLLMDTLGYRVGPQYAEATVPWPRLGATALRRGGPWDARGGWLSVTLPEGEIQAIGVETRTLIGTPAVAYSDPDTDGVDELATITIATAVTDPASIGVYVQASDRLDGEPVSEAYRIRPVRVSISGGTATITGATWLFVRPLAYEGTAVQPLDPADPGTLVQQVEVYQRTTSQAGTTAATAGAVATWETRPCHGWWCCGCTDDPYSGSPFDPAAVAQAVARVDIRDARLGIVAPAPSYYDTATGIWRAPDAAVCWEPDRVTVRYLAGVASPDGQQIARAWQTVVARLAAAELGRPICAKQPAGKELARWQFDRARISGANDEGYATSPRDLDNPFGTRAGHIQAWQYVQRVQQTRGIYGG